MDALEFAYEFEDDDSVSLISDHLARVVKASQEDESRPDGRPKTPAEIRVEITEEIKWWKAMPEAYKGCENEIQ